MAAGSMHVNEQATDVALVRRLLAAQFPQWADLPLTPVASVGTDNAIYRLGASMAVRLPRIDWAVGQVAKEHHWLPRLAPFLPLALAVPLAIGQPGEGYPWPWAIHAWLEGENASSAPLADPLHAAAALAHFITALQHIATTGGPRASDHDLRGAPLATRDTGTRAAIAAMHGTIDAVAATAVWDSTLHAPAWNRAPVWFHGDLLPGNVLVHHGRVHAVIDFGGLGIGDPACDLMIAWSLFSGATRDAFRAALAVDDATWLRGRGHALSQAVIFIPYYVNSNPVGVRNARRMLDQVLADQRATG